jgi:hypothetical protein
MHQSEIDLPGAAIEYSLGFGLWYDADRLVLEGAYLDEITAYRARKRWIQTLETNFLLEDQHDFRIRVQIDPEAEHYQVRCDFLSACGRYAFWRLTHHQAPEVQYMLETAHLPSISMVPPQFALPVQGDEEAEDVSRVVPQVEEPRQQADALLAVRSMVSGLYRLVRCMKLMFQR